MNVIKKNSTTWFAAFIVFTLLWLLAAAAKAQTVSQDNDETVVVDVWADSPALDSSEAAGPALSKGFVMASLNTMSALRSWQSHLTYMIRNGYPLAEQWIAEDSDRASDRLVLAAQAVSTNADRAAFNELNNQYRNLEQWTDSILEGKRNMELANLYMSPAGLDDDVLFQKTVDCANFLAPMLASGRLRTGVSCQ